MIDLVCTTYYSDMACVGRPSIDRVFILPVTATYTNSNNTNKCTELSKQDETQTEEIINVDSFPTHEQSALNKIDSSYAYSSYTFTNITYMIQYV